MWNPQEYIQDLVDGGMAMEDATIAARLESRRRMRIKRRSEKERSRKSKGKPWDTSPVLFGQRPPPVKEGKGC
jgi:hypothetical protein